MNSQTANNGFIKSCVILSFIQWCVSQSGEPQPILDCEQLSLSRMPPLYPIMIQSPYTVFCKESKKTDGSSENLILSMRDAWRNTLKPNIPTLYDFWWRNASRKWKNKLQRVGNYWFFLDYGKGWQHHDQTNRTTQILLMRLDSNCEQDPSLNKSEGQTTCR